MSLHSKAQEPRQIIKPADAGLLGAVMLLVVAGCWIVFDSSYSFASDTYGDVYYILRKQVVSALFGIIVMIIASNIPLRVFRLFGKPLVYINIALMVAVLIPGVGHEINGARSWFALGPLSFQPSEVLKVTLVLYLASVLSQGQVFASGARQDRWIWPVLVCGMSIGLTVLQKDFGTASILTIVALFTFFAAGARKRALLQVILLMAMIPVVVFGTGLKNTKPFRHINTRVQVQIDPWKSPFDEGYQTIHSLTALGTGGWFGRGLCKGREKMLLPEVYNDYAATTLAEEGGLVAMLLLVGVYLFLTYRGLEIGRQAKHGFGTVMAVGLTSIISVQTLINLAVVTAAIPATGVPLPFISAGGSALVSMLLAIGMILSVSRRPNEELKDRIPNESSVNRRGDRRAHISRRKRRASNPQAEARRRSPVYR